MAKHHTQSEKKRKETIIQGKLFVYIRKTKGYIPNKLSAYTLYRKNKQPDRLDKAMNRQFTEKEI